MFEKESEEYGNEYWDCLVDSDDREMLQEAYKDGAEFGYNKGKEEACDIINELLINGYDESTREKALNFLYPDKEE